MNSFKRRKNLGVRCTLNSVGFALFCKGSLCTAHYVIISPSFGFRFLLSSMKVMLYALIYHGLSTGLYTQWDSFTPRKYKINLIRTFTYRCLRICSSPHQLQSALDDLTQWVPPWYYYLQHERCCKQTQQA